METSIWGVGFGIQGFETREWKMETTIGGVEFGT